MKAKDLGKIWDVPDNTRLTPKQISIRLPLHVSAKISAICDMYPRKTKTEIIGDLLAAALDEFEQGLPDRYEEGTIDAELEGPVPSYDVGGPRGAYLECTRKHLEELESEVGTSKNISE